MKRISLTAGILITGLVVGVLTTSLVRAQPPGPGDPIPVTAFAVRSALGSCTPANLNWEDVVTSSLTMGANFGTFVTLTCPLDVGPGELPLYDLSTATIYGYDGNPGVGLTFATHLPMDVLARICVTDLPTNTTKCGDDASNAGAGDFAMKVSPPDLAGFSDRTSADLLVDLPLSSGGQSFLRGYVIDAP